MQALICHEVYFVFDTVFDREPMQIFSFLSDGLVRFLFSDYPSSVVLHCLELCRKSLAYFVEKGIIAV